MRIGSLAGPLELGGDFDRWVQAARSDQASPHFDRPGQPAPNVGDWFVTKIVDRLIDYDEVLTMTPQSTGRDWDELNETCPVLILKGGNMLYPGWFEKNLPASTLAKAKIPIVLFGAGIQNVPAGGVPFTEGDLASLRIIHEQCESSAVRGELSAQVLADHGIHNVTVTGCPTMFWGRQPDLTVRPATFDQVGFTLRTYLFNEGPDAVRAQYRTLGQLREMAARVIVVLQGEDRTLQLHDLVRRAGAEFSGRIAQHGDSARLLTKERLNEEQLLARIHDDLDHLAGPSLVEWLAVNTYSSWDPDDYIRVYRECGLMVGCRLHSNLVALANGTPGFFLTYDDRTRELVELLHAPNSPVADFDPAMLAAADWSTFTGRYRDVLFPTMVAFLERNGLPHHLVNNAQLLP
jgi:polysaccharide pyruvyl transferase WcaK-like protein